MYNDLSASAAAGTPDVPGSSKVNIDNRNIDSTTPTNDAIRLTNNLFTNSVGTGSPSTTENITITITPMSEPGPQEIKGPGNDADGMFKLPNTPTAKKRPLPSSDNTNSLETIPENWKTDNFDKIEPPNKVGIYTDDLGPQWYEVHDNTYNISKTIVPNKLPDSFNLSYFGQPESKNDLESCYEQKSREFFEGDDGDKSLSDAYDKAEQSVEDCVNKIRDALKPVQICIPLAGTQDEIMVMEPKQSHEEDLTINNMFRFRKEKDVNNIFNKKLKYRGIRFMPLLKEDERLEGPILIPGKDIMLRVRIYRPFPYSKLKAQYRGRHSVFCRDLVLIGRQKLSELRDSFVCANDLDMRLDISDRITSTCSATAKDLFPSGFLFINNVFYVDMRPGCHDISEKLREWAVSRGMGMFPVKDLTSVTVEQIPIRMGHPDVYVHQGNCEHLFTFSSIRLVNASDPLNVTHYPCHTAVSQNQTVYCTVCAEFGAKFVVTDCHKAPFDPAFFCDTCAKLYLYNNGKKICNFKAYHYRGNEIHAMKVQG